MSDAIGLCLDGVISPQVCLSRLLLGGVTPGAIASDLQARPPSPVRDALANLVSSQYTALERLAAEVASGGNDHSDLWTSASDPASVAAFFDRAVAHSPEASVALYSLGDPAILAAATQELIGWLDQQRLISASPSDILDIGCGIGRMAEALADRCRSYLGLDVSSGMVAEARRRHAQPHLRFEATDGTGLAAQPDAAFDLVLAIDSFPYIIQAGDDVVQAHISGAARVLRPGGALAILNLSYRADPPRDASDLVRWAAAAGLRAGPITAPFKLWDGTATVLRR
jgi:SAM-dependent methyltransferase